MSFVADLRFAFRSFTRAKGLALTVIVTLALGIGANAATLLVTAAILASLLPAARASRVDVVRALRSE